MELWEIEERLLEVERRERENHQILVGIQNALRIASKYKNDDVDALVAGIQAAIARGAEAKPRPQRYGKKTREKEVT